MKEKKQQAVFYWSMGIVLLVVVAGLVFPSQFEAFANGVFKLVVNNTSWLYMLIMTSFIVFCVWIGFFSPYKHLKLGRDEDEPEHSLISWFAMLFSAGMGIGLVFYGVAEPLSHYLSPAGIEPASAEAAKFAITKSFLHWGLHPWSGYAVLALGLGYMKFRHNRPGLVSSIFIPLIGEERVAGPIGKTIDILAVFATAAGMATSLGLGTYQINSGLHYMFNVPETALVQIIIVVIMAVIYTWTAVTGVDKGIKMISNLNMVLVVALLSLAVVFGPTVKILDVFVEGTGSYLQGLVGNSFELGAFSNSDWYGSWTVFYWAWWIAWAPFTGTFIARISRGRTIQQFVAGVLIVPALVSMLWFSIFGAIDLTTALDTLKEAAKSSSTALFVVLNDMGTVGWVMSLIAIALLFTFFITSANSATYVLGMLSDEGSLEPPTWKKMLWGVVQAALALSLMIGSANGLAMIQTMSIAGAFPFIFVMGAAMVAIVKAFKADVKKPLLNPDIPEVEQAEVVDTK